MQPIESLNLLLLNVGIGRHNADWNWKNILSPFTRIYLVTEGEAFLHHAKGPTIHLTPGHLYIVPAYTMHSCECHGAFTHYYLHIYEGYKKEMDILEKYNLPYEVPVEEGDEELIRRMCEKYPETHLPSSDPDLYDNNTVFTTYIKRYNDLTLASKMEIRGSILVIFSRFLQQATLRQWSSDERMKKVLDYVHNRITEEISVETLADVACITKPYLIRIFKRDIGMSPLQYVNHKKIEKAQLLLVTEDLSVKAIAYTLGFNDHSYFSRLFHKTTGRTPQEYRNLLLSDLK